MTPPWPRQPPPAAGGGCLSDALHGEGQMELPCVLYLGFPPSPGTDGAPGLSIALAKRAGSTAQGWGALSSATGGTVLARCLPYPPPGTPLDAWRIWVNLLSIMVAAQQAKPPSRYCKQHGAVFATRAGGIRWMEGDKEGGFARAEIPGGGIRGLLLPQETMCQKQDISAHSDGGCWQRSLPARSRAKLTSKLLHGKGSGGTRGCKSPLQGTSAPCAGWF